MATVLDESSHEFSITQMEMIKVYSRYLHRKSTGRNFCMMYISSVPLAPAHWLQKKIWLALCSFPFLRLCLCCMWYQGIEGFGFYDECVVPIIQNTARESHLTERLQAAITAYPKSKAVLVRRHGMYTVVISQYNTNTNHWQSVSFLWNATGDSIWLLDTFEELCF